MTKQLEYLAKQFSIGMTLFVERKMGSHNLKSSTRVIGAHDHCFLLVELPMVHGSPLFSQNGDICIVRFLHNGTLRGFKAEIERVIVEPIPMLILRCPKHIEEMPLRKHERLDCNFAGILSLDQEMTSFYVKSHFETISPADETAETEIPPNPEMKVTLLDLAVGGCQAALSILDLGDMSETAQEARRNIPMNERPLYQFEFLRDVLQKGYPCQLSFEIPQPVGKKFIDIACSVQWNKQAPAHFLVGLGFQEPTADLIESVRAIIDYQRQFFIPSIHFPMES